MGLFLESGIIVQKLYQIKFSNCHYDQCLHNVTLQLDPDNPFYLPEHLRDNPKALESVLQSKMSAGSSVSSQVSGICPESITVLLE